MPLYDYRCQSCGDRFDEFARMSTPDSEIRCPRCGKHEARKQLSRFATGASAPQGSASPSRNCGPGGFT